MLSYQRVLVAARVDVIGRRFRCAMLRTAIAARLAVSRKCYKSLGEEVSWIGSRILHLSNTWLPQLIWRGLIELSVNPALVRLHNAAGNDVGATSSI